MWDIYSRREEGIAIVSSEERCRAAFSGSAYEIYSGRVSYENYANTSFDIEETNTFDLVYKKRISFEYEKEYRFVWYDSARSWKTIGPLPGYLQIGDLHLQAPKRFTVRRDPQELEELPVTSGQNISCDLETLVEKVYVSPLAQGWFYETVQKVWT